MGSTTFREVLYPPLWLLAFIYFLFLSLALSVWAALGNLAGLLVFLFLTIILVLLRSKSAMRIEVRDGELFIGRAHVELQYLGIVTILTPAQMALTRGRNADPDAFLAIRFWQSKGLKVELNDERDPTPYWLISSKKSEALAQALGN